MEKFFTSTTPEYLKQLREATPELLWVDEDNKKKNFVDSVLTVDQDGNMITVFFPDLDMEFDRFKVLVEYQITIDNIIQDNEFEEFFFDTIDLVIHHIKVNYMLDEQIEKFLKKIK